MSWLCYRTSGAGMKNGSVKNTSALPFTLVLPAECTRKLISRPQNCLLLHTGKFFQELVYTNLKKYDNNVTYQVSQSLPGNPSRACASLGARVNSWEPENQLCTETLNTSFLIWTKCSFCIVFKWVFRNANLILWCYNHLDLLCWVADSMSVRRRLVDLSMYKVPHRKTFISVAVLCFLLILRILVCSFFYVTTMMQQQKVYDSLLCANIYLVENEFSSTFLDTFIYIM